MEAEDRYNQPCPVCGSEWGTINCDYCETHFKNGKEDLIREDYYEREGEYYEC